MTTVGDCYTRALEVPGHDENGILLLLLSSSPSHSCLRPLSFTLHPCLVLCPHETYGHSLVAIMQRSISIADLYKWHLTKSNDTDVPHGRGVIVTM
jgi:hypothetical protein